MQTDINYLDNFRFSLESNSSLTSSYSSEISNNNFAAKSYKSSKSSCEEENNSGNYEESIERSNKESFESSRKSCEESYKESSSKSDREIYKNKGEFVNESKFSSSSDSDVGTINNKDITTIVESIKKEEKETLLYKFKSLLKNKNIRFVFQVIAIAAISSILFLFHIPLAFLGFGCSIGIAASSIFLKILPFKGREFVYLKSEYLEKKYLSAQSIYSIFLMSGTLLCVITPVFGFVPGILAGCVYGFTWEKHQIRIMNLN